MTNVFGCKTKSHLQCFFPFKYDDYSYVSCTEDLPYGGKYCAIDDRGLSFDVCSADCPGGTLDIRKPLNIPRDNNFPFQFVATTLVFAISMGVLIVKHVVTNARLDMKEINVKLVKMAST